MNTFVQIWKLFFDRYLILDIQIKHSDYKSPIAKIFDGHISKNESHKSNLGNKESKARFPTLFLCAQFLCTQSDGKMKLCTRKTKCHKINLSGPNNGNFVFQIWQNKKQWAYVLISAQLPHIRLTVMTFMLI